MVTVLIIALASLSSGVAYGQQQQCGTDDAANDCEGSSEVTLPFDKELAADDLDFDKDNPIVLPFLDGTPTSSS